MDGQPSQPSTEEEQALGGPLHEGTYRGRCLDGDEIHEALMTIEDAKAWARRQPGCMGFTYSGHQKDPAGPVVIKFKSALKVRHVTSRYRTLSYVASDTLPHATSRYAMLAHATSHGTTSCFGEDIIYPPLALTLPLLLYYPHTTEGTLLRGRLDPQSWHRELDQQAGAARAPTSRPTAAGARRIQAHAAAPVARAS